MPVFNGTVGNDSLVGNNSPDTLNGLDGNDTLDGRGGRDVINAGDGNDLILDSDDSRDTISAGEGNDTYNPTESGSNSASDVVFLQGGDDTAFLGFVNIGTTETVNGGLGSDTFNYSNSGGLSLNTTILSNGTLNFNGGLAPENNYINFENVTGGNGNDTMTGNQQANVLTGNNGDDRLSGGDGADVLLGDNGADILSGDNGDDVIIGGNGNDQISGGNGNDFIIAGNGSDMVSGDAGKDTITGGGDNDVLNGGADADTFIINTLGGNNVNTTSVDGGSEGVDNDTLDFRDVLSQGFEIKSFTKNPENNGAPGFNGHIQLFNPATGQTANINYTDIEKFIPCFTPGTMIVTPQGERRVEDLRGGDRIITRDNGIQEIRWSGAKRLGRFDLAMQPDLQPVLIRAGGLGNGLPERDMLVSPNHRVLVANDKTALYFEEREVLVAAKHLVDRPGVDQVAPGGVTYIHFMFDRHEVVLSDGTWTESFQPGDLSLKGIGTAQRDEVLALFPDLNTPEGVESYGSARRTLKKHEARLLMA